MTEKCILTSHILESLAGRGRFGTFARDITRFYEDFHARSVGLRGIFLHDPTSLCFAVRPELFEVKNGGVVVVLEGPARGRCVMDSGEKRWHAENEWTRRPSVQVAIKADVKAVEAQVVDWLQRDRPAPTIATAANSKGVHAQHRVRKGAGAARVQPIQCRLARGF